MHESVPFSQTENGLTALGNLANFQMLESHDSQCRRRSSRYSPMIVRNINNASNDILGTNLSCRLS